MDLATSARLQFRERLTSARRQLAALLEQGRDAEKRGDRKATVAIATQAREWCDWVDGQTDERPPED